MLTRTLTGRTRFREQKRLLRPSLLVLQVEERIVRDTDEMGNDMPMMEHREFRDISVTDLKSPLELASAPPLSFPGIIDTLKQ